MTTKSTDDDNWETIGEGSRARITFDTIGDQFTGVYEGPEDIPFPDGDTGRYLNFRGIHPERVSGVPCAISATYQLARDFDKISPGQVCRITYRAAIPVRQGNPLKAFTVQVKTA